MKKLLILCSILLIPFWAASQTATVTGTIQDPTAQVFANGTVTIQFIPTPGASGNFNVGGNPVQLNGSNYTGPVLFNLDGTGSFSVTMSRNDFINPAKSQWQFTVCPNAAAACTVVNTTITAASVNVSSVINTAVPNISIFAGSNIPRAYSNNEVVLTPNPGQVYWNVASNALNFWNGSSWIQALINNGLGPVTFPGFITSTRGDRQIVLQNPDFEGSTVIPPPGWVLAGTSTLSYETVTQAPNKLQSLKVASTVQGSGVASATKFSVIPGDTYSITAMAKSDGTGVALIDISWRDKNGTDVGDTLVTTTSTSWVPITTSGMVPANAASAQIFLENNSVTQPSTVWFDQISIQKTNFPAPITAGSVNNVRWIGTAAGQDPSLTACNTALPSTGGTCAMTEGFTDPTWTANLVISKPNITFLIPCTANIPMSTFQLTKAGGVNGFSINQPCVPSIFGTGGHSVWQYSGTGSAFLLGDSITTTWGLNLTNVTMGLSNATASGINIINTPLFHVIEPQIDNANPATAGSDIILDGSGAAFTGSVIDGFRFYHKPFVGITFTGSGAGGFNANQVNVRGGSFVQGCATGGTGLNFVHGTGNHVETADIESCTTGVAFGNAADVSGNYVSMWQALNTTDCTFGAASTRNTCVTLAGTAAPVVSGAGIAININQGNSAYLTGDLALANGVLTKFGVDGFTSFISQQLIGPANGGVFTFLSNANSQFNLAYGAEPSTGDFSWYDGRFPSSGGTKRVTLQRTTGIFTTYGSISTSGAGVPPIYGTPVNLTGQVANLAATTIYTTAAGTGIGKSGLYRVCSAAWATATGNSTITINAIAPQPGGQVVTFPLPQTLNTAALTNPGGGCAVLGVAGSSAIQVSVTGYSTTGTYSIQATAEQLM